MKRTIEIDDNLNELVVGVFGDVEDLILEFLKEYPDFNGDMFDIFDKLNYRGGIDELIDSAVPVYYHDIDAIWYLHKDKLIQAYNNSGIGNNPLKNDGMTAIYMYIDSTIRDKLYSLDVDDYREVGTENE